MKWMDNIERRKNQVEKFSGDGNPFYGKSHSEETKKVLSEKTKAYNKKNNIRVPEWGAEKGREVVRKKIICYSIDGKFVREYKSILDAERKLNLDHTSISMCCSGKRRFVGEYTFRYKESENIPMFVELKEKKKRVKRDRPMYVFLGSHCLEYKSRYEAEKDLGIPAATLHTGAYRHDKELIYGKYSVWYKDQYDEINQAI
jgi:hypothetical protein